VRRVDIRVIAAAKIDLGNPVERGDFREDLYFRLNVVTLSIPPLRERRDDIPLLFSHFLTRAAERFRRDVPMISPAAQQHLMTHAWPGNVRELSHFAERVALGVEGPLGQAIAPAKQPGFALPERLERYEAEILKEALRTQRGDVKATIEALGIPRKTFYDKLQRHGINRADYAERSAPDKADR
jgi:two-component system C4-dicarboxylate transport response regulator DctD